MPYGYGNVPGSTITGPLANINGDGGRIVSDGSGTLNAEAFVAMTGPSFLGPAGFFSDGGNIYSNGNGYLTCRSLTVGDWYGNGEIICRQIRDDGYSWSIESNGAMRFDYGSIWSNGYGELWANRFYGDGSGLSYVYAYNADYANYAYNAYNADYANNANYSYDAYYAYNANYANSAGDANNAYYANEAYHAYQADYASNAYQLDSWSECYIYANCFVNTLQVATGNGLPSNPQNGTVASDGEYLYVFFNQWRKLAFVD
jgi:hypothetical protein